MKKLWITFLKDMKLSLNGLYFYIEIGMALVFVLVMLFVVPENFSKSQKIVAVFPENVPTLALNLKSKGFDLERVNSRTELTEILNEDHNKIGVIVTLNENIPEFEFVLQGYEGEKIVNLLRATIEGEVKSMLSSKHIELETISLEANSKKLSDRNNILPVYLTMNVALLGLFIIAAYIYLDKDEGVIKSYAVAPVTIWQYLGSKLLVMNVVGICTSLIVTLALVGFSANIGMLIIMVVFYNTFGSSLGLWISSFFETMSKAMGAMYLTLMIMLFPTVSYMMPSFSPTILKWFPTYPMLFSFKDILLNNVQYGTIASQMLIFGSLAIVFFILANRRYHKTLTV